MSRSKRAGFTLLEVLVATTIMAIAVVGLLSALNTSVRNASRLSEYDRAGLLAKRKMDELLPVTQIQRGVVMQGEFPEAETGHHKFLWQAKIVPFEAPPQTAVNQPILERIDVEVAWGEADRRRTVTLEGYRSYTPPPPSGAAVNPLLQGPGAVPR